MRTALVLLFAVVAGLVCQDASAQLKPLQLDSPELVTLDSYRRELQGLSSSENSLEQRQLIAASLKMRLPANIAALRSITEKLKSEGKWNADFDVAIEAQIQKMRGTAKSRQALLRSIREFGGARGMIEYAIAHLDSLPREIDAQLAKSVKVSWLPDPLDLIPSAHAKLGDNYRCLGVAVAAVAAGAAGCAGCAFGGALWLMANKCF